MKTISDVSPSERFKAPEYLTAAKLASAMFGALIRDNWRIFARERQGPCLRAIVI
jgi:hypothetical protein